MTLRFYEEWDWENDQPLRPIEAGAPLPYSHVAVYSDFASRPYRVIETNPPRMMPTVPEDRDLVCYYDYFYDDKGRVKEKRSLEGDFEVCLIVRYEYDDRAQTITEWAWKPGDGSLPSSHRRKLE